ncbi:hypothetical protein VTU32_06380 [Thermoanaerobacter sp. CM-CNRG TB177]|uniref:hypothetical protein n=1 Tax=Thermoanaerobacter sp. CM-CNRG TB177 TaxID=2800659 RepID=UPI001BDDF33F|nr:hypothetical protein [Thermoanaerobacter sp. CM-CNRG TB177]MBT1278924.1 hypothetical protein [Thermoanaerobacter sp. CM-CNRG TB177]
MTSNISITTASIFNNLIHAITYFSILFAEFIIIAGSFVIVIIIILGLPSITDKEKELENLSEKEKEVVIEKVKTRWAFSVFFGAILSNALFLYTKNLLCCTLTSIAISALTFLCWLYMNFKDYKKIHFLLSRVFIKE